MNRRQFLKIGILVGGIGAVLVIVAFEYPRPSKRAIVSTTSQTTLTTTSETSPTASLETTTPDYQNFILPYLDKIEMARSSTMSGPNLVSGNAFKIGYAPSMNMIVGDHTCLGDQAQQYCMIDPGYMIAVPIDRLNALEGTPTSLTTTYTSYLNGRWVFGVNASDYPCVLASTSFQINPYPWNDRRLVMYGYPQKAGIFNWANPPNTGNAFVCAPNYDDFSDITESPVVVVDVVDSTSPFVPDTSNPGKGGMESWTQWVLNQYLLGSGSASKTQDVLNYIMNDWNGTTFATIDPAMNCRNFGAALVMMRALQLWQVKQTNSNGITWLEVAQQNEAQLFGLQETSGPNAGQFSVGYSQIGDTGGEEMGYVMTSVWDQLPYIFNQYIQ